MRNELVCMACMVVLGLAGCDDPPPLVRDASMDVVRVDLGPSVWRDEPSLPLLRQGLAAAVVQGRIYLVGGFESGRVTTIVRVFDPSTGTYALGPALPTPRHHVALAVVQDDLYAFGGSQYRSGEPDASAYVLRANATVWEEIAAMPQARVGASAGYVSGKIVVAGGSAGVGALAAPVALYDPAMQRWSVGAPIPTPRENLAGFVMGTRFVVVGGKQLSLENNLRAVEAYDVANDRWEMLAPMPTARSAHAVAVLQSRAYVLGGETIDQALNTVDVLDMNTMQWSSGPWMRTGRHSHGAASVGNRVYALGGALRSEFAPMATVESFGP